MGLVAAVGLISLAAAGFVVGRLWALFLPIVVVPILYLGADQGWWGNGLGDGWYFAMAFVLLVALVATAAGTVMRRLFA